MALRQIARQLNLSRCSASSLSQWAPSQVTPGLLRSFASTLDSAKYLESHEYANPEGENAIVGISDHAQAELGDIVYVELPDVGEQVTKGEQFGVVESVKAASDINSPVSGEVVEKNEALADEPATVNKDPFGKGWLIKVKMSSKDDLDSLMDAGSYKEFCDKQEH